MIKIGDIKECDDAYYLYFGIDYNITFKSKREAKRFRTFVEKEVNKRILELNKIQSEVVSLLYLNANNIRQKEQYELFNEVENYNKLFMKTQRVGITENHNVFVFSFINKLKDILKLEITLLDTLFLRKSDTVSRYNIMIINDKIEFATKGFISWNWEKFKRSKNKILKLAV